MAKSNYERSTIREQVEIAKQNYKELQLLTASERAKISRRSRLAATDAVVGGIQAEIGNCLAYIRKENVKPGTAEYKNIVEAIDKLGGVAVSMTEARITEKSSELGFITPMAQLTEVLAAQYVANLVITGPASSFITKGYRK